MTAAPLSLLQALDACDVAALDVAGLVEAAHRVRVVRGWLDAFEAELSARADGLHAGGEGVPADELHVRTGGVSAAEARRRRRRANVLHDAPGLADALAIGAVGVEHVDLLGSITHRLEPELREKFFSHAESLVAHARVETPEDFGRRCRSVVSRIEAEAGIDRDQRCRRRTRLVQRIDADGMHHMNVVMHAELGAAVFTALDAETAALVASGGDRSVDRQRPGG